MTLNRLILISVILFWGGLSVVKAEEGIIQVQSQSSVEETANRLEAILKEKGMTLFGRVEHSAEAQKVGIELRDTVLLMFGNPQVGSLLMACQQAVALDLPLKVLIWQDEQQRVWLSYNDFEYLKARYQITGCEETLSKMEKGLEMMVKLSAE